jgi:uncharacterized protein (DUF885 family)
MAQADEALLRLCRLCVSVKMHTQGMSVEDATKFFQENCYYEEKPARAEAMRWAELPRAAYHGQVRMNRGEITAREYPTDEPLDKVYSQVWMKA